MLIITYQKNNLKLITCFAMWVLGIQGHTTMTCPHRVATEHGVIPAANRNTRSSLDYVFRRQLQPDIPAVSPPCLSCLFMW